MASEIDERMIELCKREMAKRGFNQRQLGEALGLEESEICMLLKHKRRWTLRLIQTFGKFANMIIQL